MGTGIAVDASSFQNQGVFNIARVNRWLEIVADPLGSVSANGDQAGFVPWTATQLLETVYAQAITTAPAGSDERTGFNRAKSKALEGLGGSTEISTAPLDWYDPAQIPSWPSCSIGSHASAQTGTGPSEPPAPTAPIYWGWRRIANIAALVDPPTRFDLPPANSDPASSVIANRRLMFADRAAVTMARPAPQLGMAAMESSLPAARINFTAASVTTEAEVSSEAAPLRIDRAPMALMVDRPVDSNQVLMLTQQVATTTGQAKTSASSSSSMVLSLKYLVVSLSRAPWWNEYFLSLQNWYVPAHKKGSLIDNEGPGTKIPGVPIAIVLTSDVAIRSAWSEADSAATTTNTHVGPWSLSSSQFSAVSSDGKAVLTIPGVTAIACVYRQLPSLPPQSDPSLPA